MSCKEPLELAGILKRGGEILILAGALCDRVDFNGKLLLDYVVEIAGKTGAPVGATGNTALGLKAKGVESVKKMWVAEVVNYMRHQWEEPITARKPDLLVFIGYNQAVARRLVSAVKEGETMVLGNTEIKVFLSPG